LLRRDVTWVASSEWPPSSKKSSSAPTSGTRSTSCQTRATARSRSVRGAMNSPWAVAKVGAGRALRSTLPLELSGRASIGTQAEGTM